MLRTLVGTTLALAAVSVVPAVEILPFDEVVAGMRGTGKTAFAGTTVETFDVEILGKLPNVGPDQDLILARLSGGPLASTGVLAGMSGSPVFIDGRLVGAVAYSWGFTKEPIAGITPAAEMLALVGQDGEVAPRRRAGGPWAGDLDRLASTRSLSGFFRDLERRLLPVAASPLHVPLTVSGLAPAAVRRALPELTAGGWTPIRAAGAGSSAEAAPPLEPGSPMGLKLVRGDVEMTATGTVTWVDGDTLVGFGHPLFGLGGVDLPLTGAKVEAVIPSLYQSSRIATPLAEVGALRQDRSAGVVGRLGASPTMIPVRLELAGAAAEEHRFSFDVADDPLLSPLLLYASLRGILASKERAFGNATVRLREGSVIKMAGSPDVEIDNVFAGPAAFDLGTGIGAYILYLLMNNTWSEPRIAGINLLFEYDDAPKTARIRRATLDRYHVRAGESVEVTVVLGPYRGPDRILTREIQVPPETPAGVLTVAIGGAVEVSRASHVDEPVLPKDLDQLIWLINRLRRNDHVYIVASHEDSGVLLGGSRLPNLPPSVATVLTRPRSSGNLTVIRERSVLEELIRTDYAVAGSAKVELNVEVR